MYPEIELVQKQMNYMNFTWKEEMLEVLHNKRLEGHVFTWQEHLESLLLSILSANRPWSGIARSIDSLREIFFDYNVDKLYKANPESLADSICNINCGNRRIYTSMRELRYNINVLRNIERLYGNVDAFAQEAVKDPIPIMHRLSENYSQFKLKGVGKALALEYLKRVGVDVVKPDVHVRRILQRFGYFSYLPSEEETFILVRKMSQDLGIPMYEIGSILWSFCATGYLEICTATPKCQMCVVQCKSSTGCSKETQRFITLVKWYNYINKFEDFKEEIERLSSIYKSKDVEVFVKELCL